MCNQRNRNGASFRLWYNIVQYGCVCKVAEANTCIILCDTNTRRERETKRAWNEKLLFGMEFLRAHLLEIVTIELIRTHNYQYGTVLHIILSVRTMIRMEFDIEQNSNATNIRQRWPSNRCVGQYSSYTLVPSTIDIVRHIHMRYDICCYDYCYFDGSGGRLEPLSTIDNLIVSKTTKRSWANLKKSRVRVRIHENAVALFKRLHFTVWTYTIDFTYIFLFVCMSQKRTCERKFLFALAFILKCAFCVYIVHAIFLPLKTTHTTHA